MSTIVSEILSERKYNFSNSNILRDDSKKQIYNFLEFLFPEGWVVELRALFPKYAMSGFYNNRHILSQHAIDLSLNANGVYVTLQYINPGMLERRPNKYRIIKPSEGTCDKDIFKYLNVLVDFDVPHPGQNSTDQEVILACDRACKCRDYLTSIGFPEPLFGMSGNGAHLIYKVDLVVDDKTLVHRFLLALNDRFGGAGVTVDRSVFNPSRITKLFGTKARKAPGDFLRPQRHAKLLSIPTSPLEVPRELLVKVAGEPPIKVETPSTIVKGEFTFCDHDQACESASLPLDERIRRATLYVQKVPGTTDGNNASIEGLKLASKLAIGFLLPFDEAFEIMSIWGRKSDQSTDWTEKKIKHKISEAIKNPSGYTGAAGDLLLNDAQRKYAEWIRDFR